MKKQFFLGVDPGSQGAATILDIKGAIAWNEPLGGSLLSMLEALPTLKDWPGLTACLEQVHAMPGQGVSTMFSFGKNFGYAEMALFMLCIPTRLVHASTWTRAIHRAKGATAKERSVKTAKMLWPDRSFLATQRSKVPHSGLVDSALIAEYGRRMVLAELAQGF